MHVAAAAGAPGAAPTTFPVASVTKFVLAIHGTPVDLVALKSDGLPVKFQRSTPSPVRLRLVPVSITPQGCAPNTLTMVFTCHPSNSCPYPFTPGMAYVAERVNRCRIS